MLPLLLESLGQQKTTLSPWTYLPCLTGDAFFHFLLKDFYPLLPHRFQIGYDRRVRPNYGGPPVTVGVSLYVLSLSEISEKFMDFTFDMYFR